MTKKELAKITNAISIAYPRFEATIELLELWYELLGDLDYQVTSIAVKKLLLESPYPPSISDIRKRATELLNPNAGITSADAWGEVMKAISNYGSYREEEALNSMSERTRRVVKYLNWKEICMSDKLGIIRSQFNNMYEQVTQRENNENLLPRNIKQDIAKLTKVIDIKQIGRGVINE